MGKEYLKADEKDYEELVDFINYVFSHSGGKRIFHPYCLNYIRIRIKLSTII